MDLIGASLLALGCQQPCRRGVGKDSRAGAQQRTQDRPEQRAAGVSTPAPTVRPSRFITGSRRRSAEQAFVKSHDVVLTAANAPQAQRLKSSARIRSLVDESAMSSLRLMRPMTVPSPEMGSRAGSVVRTYCREGPHSAGFRPARSATKRMSRRGRLAEEERLWSNILCAPGDRQMVADASSVRRRPSQSR
jgi:hypothetical protein